ncbi:MAG: hypothetical protein ACW99J_10060 [Candidatus Thorarchaeota archaeon]|jgi:ribonuclease HIII
MTATVIRIKSELLGKLREVLERTAGVTSASVTNPYEAFRIRYMGGQIVAYTSGKVVTNRIEVSELVREVLSDVLPAEVDYDIVIGSDEAGKGEWLGPLCIAAVAMNWEQESKLIGLGVMDSKDVPLEKIQGLSGVIQRHSICIETVLISPEKFNIQLAEFHNEGKNLNDLLSWAHAKAISETYEKVVESARGGLLRIVVDEFAREKTRSRLSRVLNLDDVDLVQKHYAEDEVAVASASIVARNAREVWIDEASDRLGTDLRLLDKVEAKERRDTEHLAKLSYLD